MDSLSKSIPLPAVFTVVIASVGCIIYYLIIYPLFISPLSRIPGPKIAALTPLYLDSRYWTETAAPLIERLHHKYGPIVRVGPNEVVVNDPDQLQVIYGVRSTFPKPEYSVLFENFGFPNAFSAVTREEHKERRRRVAKVYTMSSMLNNHRLLQWIRNRMDIVLNKMDAAPDNKLDIYQVSAQFALDNVSFMNFGESMGLLDGRHLGAADRIRYTTIASCPRLRFQFLTYILSLWPINFFMPTFLKRAMVSYGVIEGIIKGEFDRVSNSEKKCEPQTAAGCIQNGSEYGNTISDGHVLSECADHILAGGDTTAASISYTFYTLALPHNLKYQKRLREEILSLSQPLDYKEVCNLPFLNTCVLEILRVYAPGPGSLQQRSTPPGMPTVINIGGKSYTLPPGTQIGVQAYSIHRNEEVYGSDVETFRPERWEQGDTAQLQKMKDAWIPFGTGSRICIGMSLAMIELKFVIAATLLNHTIEIPPNSNPDDMIPLYGAVIRPKAEKCDLIFKKVS